MSLRDRIQTDVTAAMRSGDSLRRDVLRMAQNAVYAVEKRERREPTDDDVAAILTREVKTRRESIDAFRTGGREDLAVKEEAEIAILAEARRREHYEKPSVKRKRKEAKRKKNARTAVG